jgi:hypothetical protein
MMELVCTLIDAIEICFSEFRDVGGRARCYGENEGWGYGANR